MYESQIYLYEANPFCCEVLRKKFSKFSNIKIFNYGVSNIDGYRKLYLHTNAQTHFSLGEGSSFDKSKENINTNNFLLVKCVSVHNILKKFKRINLLKVDIEGDEYRIINTIIKNINKIDKVFCEFHKRSYLQKKRYIKTISLLKTKNLYNKKICKWI
jgi:FkbM family methyltransferase